MEIAEVSSQELSLKEYVEIVRRRKWAVLYTFGIVLTLGFVATAITTPVYRAQAKLLVRAAGASFTRLDADNPLVDLLALSQPESVETQIEVLQSDPFLNRVLGESRLDVRSPKAPHIRASRIQDTNVIDISVESPDQNLARDVANRMVGQYLDYTREVSLTEIKAAEQFVGTERARAKRALEKAEHNLLEFRRSHRVAQLTAEQESRTKELVELETHRRENANGITRVAAQIAEVKAQLAQEPATKQAPTGRPNPKRDALLAQLADLESKRDHLLAEYRPHSQPVAAIEAEMARLSQRLKAVPAEQVMPLTTANPAREELRTRLKELDRDLQGLKAEQDQLAAQFAGKAERMNQLGPWEIQLGQLTRVRDAAQKSFQLLDEKLQDLSIREHARRSVARIIEPAALPQSPIRPRKSLNLVMAALMGMVLGLSVAFLQEYLDDRITTTEEVDRVLGLPVLAHVPMITGQQSPLMTALPPRSPGAESYRALRTSISFAAIDHPVRTLLLSSATKGEGKSVTSMNLAIAIAMDGRRVILVDTDLRRPSVHHLLDWEMTPGLTDVLVGNTGLHAALREHPEVPGLQILTSGPMPPNPAELVNSAPMEELIRTLAGEADIVIFDCPPCLPLTDAALLSTKVDGVLLVADITQARRAGLKYTKEQFERARARVVGLVFNKVTSKDGYHYYYYYHRGYYGTSKGDLGDGNGNGNGNGHKGLKGQNGRRRRALAGRPQHEEEEKP